MILTNQRLALLSAPIFRPARGVLRDSFPKDAITVARFDPRMMETPELHLNVGDRPLRLDTIDRFWAPELVELHRQLVEQAPSEA